MTFSNKGVFLGLVVFASPSILIRFINIFGLDVVLVKKLGILLLSSLWDLALACWSSHRPRSSISKVVLLIGVLLHVVNTKSELSLNGEHCHQNDRQQVAEKHRWLQHVAVQGDAVVDHELVWESSERQADTSNNEVWANETGGVDDSKLKERQERNKRPQNAHSDALNQLQGFLLLHCGGLLRSQFLWTHAKLLFPEDVSLSAEAESVDQDAEDGSSHNSHDS